MEKNISDSKFGKLYALLLEFGLQKPQNLAITRQLKIMSRIIIMTSLTVFSNVTYVICLVISDPDLFTSHLVLEVTQALVRGASRIIFGNKKHISDPASMYLLKVKNGNTRTMCEIYSKLTITTTE